MRVWMQSSGSRRRSYMRMTMRFITMRVPMRVRMSALLHGQSKIEKLDS